MSSIGAVDSTASDRLYALRQQLAARLAQNSPPTNTGNACTDGSSASTSADGAAGMSGGPLQLGTSTLSILVELQEFSTSDTGATQSVSGGERKQALFAKLDANGDGSLSQAELSDAVTGKGGDADQAAALFGKLDSDGDRSVSGAEFAAGTPKGHHHGHHGGGGHVGGDDGLFGAGSAGAATTSTGADGSTVSTAVDGTTTLTYADGTTITLTPAAADDSSGGQSGAGAAAQKSASERLLTNLIRLQSELAPSAAQGQLSLAA